MKKIFLMFICIITTLCNSTVFADTQTPGNGIDWHKPSEFQEWESGFTIFSSSFGDILKIIGVVIVLIILISIIRSTIKEHNRKKINKRHQNFKF